MTLPPPPPPLTSPTLSPAARAGLRKLRLSRVVREHCEIVLGMTNGKVREAADILDVGFSTLYRWIGEWKREDER